MIPHWVSMENPQEPPPKNLFSTPLVEFYIDSI